MTAAQPVVVDTMAVSALVNEQRDPDTARDYRKLVADRPVLVSFVTIAEMRYGAIKAGWGELRTRGLERSLSQVVVVQPDDELIRACASLRARVRAWRSATRAEASRGRPVDRRHRTASRPRARLGRRRVRPGRRAQRPETQKCLISDRGQPGAQRRRGRGRCLRLRVVCSVDDSLYAVLKPLAVQAVVRYEG